LVYAGGVPSKRFFRALRRAVAGIAPPAQLALWFMRVACRQSGFFLALWWVVAGIAALAVGISA